MLPDCQQGRRVLPRNSGVVVDGGLGAGNEDFSVKSERNKKNEQLLKRPI